MSRRKRLRYRIVCVLVLTMFGTVCLGRTITYLTAAQSVKWGLIGVLVPGAGWACLAIATAWTVAGVAASDANVDPPVTGIPKIAYVATYPGRNRVNIVHPGEVVQIVGEGAAEFEFIPNTNGVYLDAIKAIGPVFASTQAELVVGIPLECPPGKAELTVENSFGKSEPLTLTVAETRQLASAGHFVAAPGDLASDFGVATRDFFDAFEALAANCPTLQEQELPNFGEVDAALDAYFLALQTSTTEELSLIDAAIAAGEGDLVALTYSSMAEVQCGTPVPTLPEWGLIVLGLLLLVGGTIVFFRKRGGETAVA